MQKYFPFLAWLPLAKKSWKDDLIAGITGTIIVIPQAVAFAMIAGLPPIYGFYTAIITPVIAALFGSSYHLISGPTTAASLVTYAILVEFVNPENDIQTFIALAMVLSFLAGFFKLMMGILKMGKLVNFVSHSVVIGFTAGAGILIAFKQLKHVFGHKVPQGSTVIQIITYISTHILDTNWLIFLVAIFTLLIAILIKKFIPLIARYHMLIAMLLGTFLAMLLGGEKVGIETVGQVPSNFPPFKVPPLNFANIQKLSSGALVLALLGLIEAISIARSVALNSKQRINANQEFIGQGLSNIVGSFFSSYTSSGSFTRSGVNYQAGAKTPMAAIFSSVFLLLVVLFLAGYASYLPKATMGGIILLVGYNLVDIPHIKQAIKSSNRELIVLGITFFGTLFFELQFALLAGVIASLFFYLERTSKPNIAILGLNAENKFINILRQKNLKECSSLKIVRVDGSMYFASIEVVSDFFSALYDGEEVQNILVECNGINFIDLGAAEWLTNEVLKWQETRGGVYFSGMKLISQDILKKGGFMQKMGADIFFTDKNIAITEIHKKLDVPCEEKAFRECE